MRPPKWYELQHALKFLPDPWIGHRSKTTPETADCSDQASEGATDSRSTGDRSAGIATPTSTTPSTHNTPPERTETSTPPKAATTPASHSPTRGPDFMTRLARAPNRPRRPSGVMISRTVFWLTVPTVSAAPSPSRQTKAGQTCSDRPRPMVAIPKTRPAARRTRPGLRGSGRRTRTPLAHSAPTATPDASTPYSPTPRANTSVAYIGRRSTADAKSVATSDQSFDPTARGAHPWSPPQDCAAIDRGTIDTPPQGAATCQNWHIQHPEDPQRPTRRVSNVSSCRNFPLQGATHDHSHPVLVGPQYWSSRYHSTSRHPVQAPTVPRTKPCPFHVEMLLEMP